MVGCILLYAGIGMDGVIIAMAHCCIVAMGGTIFCAAGYGVGGICAGMLLYTGLVGGRICCCCMVGSMGARLG